MQPHKLNSNENNRITDQINNQIKSLNAHMQCTYARAHTHTHTYTRTCTQTHKHNTDTHPHKNTHKYTQTLPSSVQGERPRILFY